MSIQNFGFCKLYNQHLSLYNFNNIRKALISLKNITIHPIKFSINKNPPIFINNIDNNIIKNNEVSVVNIENSLEQNRSQIKRKTESEPIKDENLVSDTKMKEAKINKKAALDEIQNMNEIITHKFDLIQNENDYFVTEKQFQTMDKLKINDNVKELLPSILLKQLYTKRMQSRYDFKIHTLNSKQNTKLLRNFKLKKQKTNNNIAVLKIDLNNDGLLLSNTITKFKRKNSDIDLIKFAKVKQDIFMKQRVHSKPYEYFEKPGCKINKSKCILNDKHNKAVVKNEIPINFKIINKLNIIPHESLWQSNYRFKVPNNTCKTKERKKKNKSKYKYETKKVLVGNKLTKVTYLVVK